MNKIELIRTELEQRSWQRSQWYKRYEDPVDLGVLAELNEILAFLDTLEAEQKEVDLEKEIDGWYNGMGIPLSIDALRETARHFYELGKNSK